MLKLSTSTGGAFTFPLTLEDVTLNQFLQYLQLVEPTKPKCLKDLDNANEKLHFAETEKEKEEAEQEIQNAIDAITDIVKAKHVYPYYARVVAFFADGLTEADILGKKDGQGMNVHHLTSLYLRLVNLFNDLPEVEYSNVMEVNGELWYLPNRYMEGATVIEFAEAAQFQANVKDLEGGDWAAMAKIMCVLVRKENEVYSDKLLRREPMFLEWNMLNVWRVAFFLSRLSERYLLSFRAYTNAQELTRLKQELKD